MHINLDIAPARTTVRGYAEDAVLNMRRVYGITLDYSLTSLSQLDRILSEWREGGATVGAVTKSLYAFGSYAGEALREQEPGRWVAPPESAHGDLDSLFLFVRLMDGREWRPIAIAFQALLEGPQHSLAQSAERLLASDR